jgi:hypothetical protein
VSTPSAALPSSSILTAVSARLLPTRSVFAFSEKRPKPPPGSCLWPAQRTASRSEAASAATVPSIFQVGRLLNWPSKASFSGAPVSRSLIPDGSPSSAATKSPMPRLASTCSPRQSKRPVAPKLRNMEGQASEPSILVIVSAISRASSRITRVPWSTRTSEKEAVRSELGRSAALNVLASDVQFDFRPGSRTMLTVGRTNVTSDTWIRPISSGKKRSRAVRRSAVSALLPAPSSPMVTSSRLTVPKGKNDTEAGPRTTGSSPATARISAFTASRAVSAETKNDMTVSSPAPMTSTAARANPRRLKPLAAVTKSVPACRC